MISRLNGAEVDEEMLCLNPVSGQDTAPAADGLTPPSPVEV